MMGHSSSSAPASSSASAAAIGSSRPATASDAATREAKLRKEIMERAGGHVPVGEESGGVVAPTTAGSVSTKPEGSSNTISAWGDEAKEESKVEAEKLRVAKKILKGKEESNKVPDEAKIRNASPSRALKQDVGAATRRPDPRLAVSTAKRNTGYAIPISSFGGDELDDAEGQARGL